MFADSLLDSTLISRSHRGWTTLISFFLEALMVGSLLMVPLLYTEGLPSLRLMRPEVIGPTASPGPAAKIEPSHSRNLMLKNASGLILMPPQQIPKGISPETSVPVGPPPELATGGSTSGSGGSGTPNGILNSTGDTPFIVIPPRPVYHPPISHWMEGNLVRRVQPAYPSLAVQTRTQGQVVLRAVISREGTIENLQVVSGHPLLVRAAIEAVRQWRYRPYVLNGEPVEVETQVTVNFVLSGG
jgi:periplasmic protein TonB